jgi:hypothetical protein
MQDETALYGAKMMQPGMTAADSEENNLRPQHLEDYIGQEKVKQNLKIYLEAAKRRGASSPTRWGCRSASPAARPLKSPATLPPC